MKSTKGFDNYDENEIIGKYPEDESNIDDRIYNYGGLPADFKGIKQGNVQCYMSALQSLLYPDDCPFMSDTDKIVI